MKINIDAQMCLKKLEYVGVLNFATVGLDGSPQVRCISAIHYEPDALHFFTAEGKAFCEELLADGRVQIMAYTRYKEMIRVTAEAVLAPDPERKKYMELIFAEQPYLADVYPGDTREIGVIFSVRDMEIDYFHLGVHPIFRWQYAVGNAEIRSKGYEITDRCIGCGKCADNCPQRCIEAGSPYRISQNHCLHCGGCKLPGSGGGEKSRKNDSGLAGRTEITGVHHLLCSGVLHACRRSGSDRRDDSKTARTHGAEAEE